MRQGAVPAQAGGSRVSPWVVGIIIGFVVLVLVNAAFITIAVKGADPVVPSYIAEER
jgi:hypothetical protein